MKTTGPSGHITPDSPFQDVIQRAYQVFERPTPTDTMTCECCMYPEIRADFLSHKPQDLPLHYVQDWFSAAVNIPLPQDFLAYLLPRILEILASGEEPSSIGCEVSLDRFPTGQRNA